LFLVEAFASESVISQVVKFDFIAA